MGATQKITCLSAIIFAIGEMRLISIISFRLCGEHLLSLHDESRQRRAKEREDNRSERFSSLSLESFPSFDRSRFASVAEAPGAYRYVIAAWFARPWRFNFYRPQLRANQFNVLDNVSPRALAVRRRRAAPAGIAAVRARGAYAINFSTQFPRP